MGAKVVSFLRVFSRDKDWTRDELAELYRIENALVQARMSLHTDRGLSDEGDPWFAFCRSDGEVLVHICRYDGEYRLYTSALAQPLTGRSFSALAKSFVSQVPQQASLRQSKGSRVFVHPAAMLAIVIGTIFFSWDDLLQNSQRAAADGSAAGGDRKQSLQASVLSYIDSFLGHRGDGAASQGDSTYLNLISTVAAFIVGVGLGTVTDQQPAPALVAQDETERGRDVKTADNSQPAQAPDGQSPRKANGEVLQTAAGQAEHGPQWAWKDAAGLLHQPEVIDAAHQTVGPHLVTAEVAEPDLSVAGTLFAMAVASAQGVADRAASAQVPLDEGHAQANHAAPKPAPEAASPAPHADPASTSAPSDVTTPKVASQSAPAATLAFEDSMLKFVAGTIGSGTNLKVLSLDALSPNWAGASPSSFFIRASGDASHYLEDHKDLLSLDTTKVTAPVVPAVVAADPAASLLSVPPISQPAIGQPAADSAHQLTIVGSLVQTISGDEFAHILRDYINNIKDITVVLAADEMIFADSRMLSGLDSNSHDTLKIGVTFQDGTAISIIGQQAAILDMLHLV